MKGRLAEFISELFVNAPKTRQAHELREELLSNLQDKYDDLIESGYTPEEAYQNVVSNVGDVQELISALDTPQQPADSDYQQQRKRTAIFTAIGVMLLILSPMFSEMLGSFGLGSAISSMGFFICVAAGVGTLIYTNMTKPENQRHERADDTLVEDFKEYSSNNKAKKSQKNALISLVVTLILPLYFFISFLTGAWDITWILFLLIPLLITLINFYYAFKD